MAKIQFSHAYKKLMHLDANGNVIGGPIKSAKLLMVLVVPMETIKRAADFLEYDTDNGKYTLTFSNFYVMLLFRKPNGELFTTVRPQWSKFGDKKVYYDKLIGQDLEVVITKGGES